MFVHPRCPCSRASLNELERLTTRLGGRLVARVVFVRPLDAPPGWERTDTWRRAIEVVGAQAISVQADAAGDPARTSGSVTLFDADGQALFRGGITSSRGHEGESVGFQRIVSLVERGTADARESPVFGCGLFDAQEEKP
jgi:hypothetical protein